MNASFLDPGHHRPREVHDGVPVRLHRLGGVDDEGQGRVDDDLGGRRPGALLAAAAVDAPAPDAAVAVAGAVARDGGSGLALAVLRAEEAFVGAVRVRIAVA